jgi:hypothetical protein
MQYKKYLLIIVLTLSFLFIVIFIFRPACENSSLFDDVEPGMKPHESDGKGMATVHPPEPVRVLQRGTWTITYVTGPRGIATGGGIVFQVSPFWEWSQPQSSDPDYTGYTSVSSSNPDVKFELQGSNLNYLLIAVSEGELAEGDTVWIIYGDTDGDNHMRGAAIVDRYSETGEEFFLKVDGNGDQFYSPIEDQPLLDILAAEASKIVIAAPPIVVEDETFEFNVSTLDLFDNWDRSYTGTIVLAGEEELLLPRELEMTAVDSGVVIAKARAKGVGKYRIRASTSDGSIESESDPILCIPDNPEYNLYWGDLHGHSGISDGSGSPGEYYLYARHVSGMDVSALTDHDAHGLLPLDENPEIWKTITRTTNRHYVPGEFVTYLGYEWTNWTYGHRHILFPGDTAEVYSFRDPRSDTPSELGELLSPWKAIAIPHHPAGGAVRIDWDHHEDRYEPLVEICSVHGNSDSPGAPLQIYRSVKGAFVTDALQREYRMGILASGDTHDGHPGRKSVNAPSMGIAGIWADSLTREEIWDSILSRRIYGTSGERIILRFKADGHWMGEIIPLAGQKDIEVEVFVVGTSSINKVELLEREEVIKTIRPQNGETLFRWELQAEPPTFYRVRITQEGDGMAWSSPIWFTKSGRDR